MIGILTVDKPEGPTSHDIVQRVRRTLGEKRIGHTGTLDPFASGLLVLCVGTATRLAEYLEPLSKGYEATAVLGTATDTDDRTGAVLRTTDAWADLDEEAISHAFTSQVGERMQRPPAFSAKKLAGERAYRRARRGEDVRPEPVPVTIQELVVESRDGPRVTFRVECGPGTYIRAIARDAGEALGVGAHLDALRRTRVGRYAVDAAAPADALDDAGTLAAFLEPPLAALDHLPRLDLDDDDARRVRHGSVLPRPDSLHDDGRPVALALQDELVAVAEITERGIQPRKVFA